MNSDYHDPGCCYGSDLAYIHDEGYGDFARRSAPGLLKLLVHHGITEGRVVDLGCGSGIWSRELVAMGYQVVGVDFSPAMIDLARQRVPEAYFHVQSLFRFRLPPCRAVTALGEVLNYLFDSANSLSSLRRLYKNVFEALAPNGLLIFDVAEPGRSRGRQQAFTEGDDWTCLVNYEHNLSKQQLTRRIVTFRKIDGAFRRHEEIHRQQLYKGPTIAQMLRQIGFRVRLMRCYGEFRLSEGVVGILARKP